MSRTIAVQDWVEHVEQEYLATFVREGGAAIKFAVAADGSLGALREAVRRACAQHDYVYVPLDAAELRAHMPQDIFFGLARRLPWRELVRRRILRLVGRLGYAVHGIDPDAAGNVFEAIAAANGLDPTFVFSVARKPIQDEVFRSARMARDFRMAMTHLCLAEGAPDGGEYAGQPLLDWLRGDNTRVGSVRQYDIYASINRTTARYLLESALRWVRDAGHAGTVVLLDNRRVTLARNPRDGVRYYTRAMTMDHYELLREFVDNVDRLAGTLLLVATDEGFLDGPRSFDIYEALKTRVMDDVHDRRLVNPAAALVRLAEESALQESAP